MSKRDDLIATYAGDLRSKCKVEPQLQILHEVA